MPLAHPRLQALDLVDRLLESSGIAATRRPILGADLLDVLEADHRPEHVRRAMRSPGPRPCDQPGHAAAPSFFSGSAPSFLVGAETPDRIQHALCLYAVAPASLDFSGLGEPAWR